MAPQGKASEADNLDMPKRSHKLLSLREKVKVLNLIRKEKKSSAEVAEIDGKNKSIREIVKKEKKKFVQVLLLHLSYKSYNHSA